MKHDKNNEVFDCEKCGGDSEIVTFESLEKTLKKLCEEAEEQAKNIELIFGLKPNHKAFRCANGKTYGAHEKSCLFCKHNTDIFYDYTNGPYAFACDADGDVDESFEGKCEKFESD